MSPSAIQQFRLKAASARNLTHGVEITFRGAPIRVILSPVRTTFDLESGGLNPGGEHTVYFLSTTLTTPPARGEQVTFSGRKYTVTELRDVITTFGEYIVTIRPGSKL